MVPTDVPTRGSHRDVPRAPRRRTAVVRKDNGGKADALNVGINPARHPLVCMVDADSLLDPDALLPCPGRSPTTRCASSPPAAWSGSPTAARISPAASSTCGCRGRWLPSIQVVEYLRAFLLGRTGWSRLGGLLVISGAFGVFRRDLLVELGGLATDCIGEDAELVVRLHRRIGDNARRPGGLRRRAGGLDGGAEDRAVLRRQRRRWHRGLTEILSKHRGMVLRPRYGMVGMVSLPWFVVFELMAPFVEVFGVAFLVFALVLMSRSTRAHPPAAVDQDVIWALLATSLLYAVVLTLAAL